MCRLAKSVDYVQQNKERAVPIRGQTTTQRFYDSTSTGNATNIFNATSGSHQSFCERLNIFQGSVPTSVLPRLRGEAPSSLAYSSDNTDSVGYAARNQNPTYNNTLHVLWSRGQSCSWFLAPSAYKMSCFRPMTAGDLFKFNSVNLDGFTETFLQSFYLRYLSNWPELCIVADAPDGTIAGYIMGKVEGTGMDWHGHVTALSVAPEFRKCGLAQKLMSFLENISEMNFKCYYVDLYVRVSNTVAVNFYRKLGYRVWKTEKGYYSGKEDALDMRKPLSHDVDAVCLKGAEEPL